MYKRNFTRPVQRTTHSTSRPYKTTKDNHNEKIIKFILNM